MAIRPGSSPTLFGGGRVLSQAAILPRLGYENPHVKKLVAFKLPQAKADRFSVVLLNLTNRFVIHGLPPLSYGLLGLGCLLKALPDLPEIF